PGIVSGYSETDKQEVERVFFLDGANAVSANDSGSDLPSNELKYVPLTNVDAVALSEVLRDLTELAGKGEGPPWPPLAERASSASLNRTESPRRIGDVPLTSEALPCPKSIAEASSAGPLRPRPSPPPAIIASTAPTNGSASPSWASAAAAS